MKVTTAIIKEIPAFSDVPEEQIDWLLSKSEVREIAVDDHIFVKGDPIDKLLILVEGKVEIKIQWGNNYRTVGVMEAGGIGGFLPYSRATTAVAEGIVIKEGRIVSLSKQCCKEMSLNHYELTAVFVHEMTSRTREFAKSNVQAEKMMALGKLSAGLAHELNNPASAIVRSAKELKKHLKNVPEKFKAVMSMRVDEDQVDKVNEIVFNKLSADKSLSLMERSNLEDELEEWLEDRGFDESYELIDTLLDFNFKVSDVEKLLEVTGDENFKPTLNWVGNVLTTEKMVDEIDDASNRISDLVQSVKGYTHMDSAPERQEANLEKGIKSTLTMLNHKLKRKQISVELDMDENLRSPKVMISEINQVWTNLIDNAIDAMEEKGTLQIKGYNNGSCVSVEIIDDGSGINEEHLSKIFDPFFTTKAMGEGTGMGLEVVYRIINQHSGDINVESKPGRTCFKVDIPIE